MKCFQIIDGIKCYAFAHAVKKGKTLVISSSFSDLIDAHGCSISGTYKIISEGSGNVADVICEKQ